MSQNLTPAAGGELLIYPAGDGIRVLLTGETVWLTQRQIAELYSVSVPTVNEHLAAVYEEREIEPERTIRKFRIVQMEGARSMRRDAERRRLEAAQAAEARYLGDLRSAAEALDREAGSKPGKQGEKR